MKLWGATMLVVFWLWAQAVAQFTVVLDAGHGGHDSGCLGKKHKEKDIALSITLKVGEMLTKTLPQVKVIYTRTEDRFVELHKRTDIANKAKADLFVSIHCNAHTNPSIYGTETYVMGLHKNEDNLRVAMRENAVILKEENYMENYGNFDPTSPEAYIIFNLYQSAFLKSSIELAHTVERNLTNIGRYSRGVKQAGFLVLYRAAMPSVLIETGFLTNPEEEEYLASSEGQQAIARAIAEAIAEYLMRLDSIREETLARQKNQPATETWWIQILATQKQLKPNTGPLKGIHNLKIEKNNNGTYRYLVGPFHSLEEAQRTRDTLRKKGFKDCFIRKDSPSPSAPQ